MPARPRLFSFVAPRRAASPGPPSPTFSEVTNASAFNFGSNGPAKIITRTDLRSSLHAYDDVMAASAAYRSALLAMSKATAAFADSMERCSGLKGPAYEAGSRLQAAAGVHHLIGNLWHVLAETLDKNFEKPLRQHLDTYKTIVNERSTSYERALRERSRIIRQTEMRNMNRKERNLQSFREALTVLQRQVDELDELKAAHYQEILEHEEEVWNVVQNKVCIVVRSTMDIFDRFTAKASDPIIEPMLQSVPDPFDAYGPPQSEDQIFSILAPLSIMAHPASSSSAASSLTNTPEQLVSKPLPSSTGSKKVLSWLPTNSTNGNSGFATEAGAWADAHYAVSPPSTPPRSVSPTRNLQLGRRHSVPSHRKPESKLRSSLTMIDEGLSSKRHEESVEHSHEIHNDDPSPQPPATPPTHVVDSNKSPSPCQTATEPNSEPPWAFTYGLSPYEPTNNSSNPSTPRNNLISFTPATDSSDYHSLDGTNSSDRRDLEDQNIFTTSS